MQAQVKYIFDAHAVKSKDQKNAEQYYSYTL